MPLILEGVLNEGTATSWTSDLGFLDEFGDKFDDASPNAVAGAIFRHIPKPSEVILNIAALWADDEFVKCAEAYRAADGEEAKGLFHFKGRREQSEIVLRAPLRRDEIYFIFRRGDLDSLAKTAGAKTDDDRTDLLDALLANGIDLRDPGYRPPAVTQRIVQRVADEMRQRLEARAAILEPHLPDGKRGRLKDAVALGTAGSNDDARLLGWRRLHGRDGVMQARWSDGTIVFHRRGFIWIAPRMTGLAVGSRSVRPACWGESPTDLRLLRRHRTPPFPRTR
ncbi:MAG: hypothetical protein EOP62_11730 [Sphingomonadales bacterium]|nr:MAG: hypothetical protein EOP62_11730 [Sphingomonadales bacterium]